MTIDFYILGGGIAGLGAASILREKCFVFEKEKEAGGLCKSKKINNFIFDNGTHVFFTKNKGMIQILDRILKNNYFLKNAEIWNYYYKIFFPHPVQVNTVYLPEDLKIECILSYIRNLIYKNEKEILTYEDWCLDNFGEKFSEEFFLRYAKKFWLISPKKLNIDWISSRILKPDLDSVIRGAFKKNQKTHHYITQFRYPKNNGFGNFIKLLSSEIPNIKLNHEVTSINLKKSEIEVNKTMKYNYKKCISTIPLPELLKLCKDLPNYIKECLKKLNWTSNLVINLAFEHPIDSKKHYEYYYDDEIPFYRANFPSNLSQTNVPKGKGSISLEIAYNSKESIDFKQMLKKSVESLIEIGYIRSEKDILFHNFEIIKYAYIIFDFNRTECVNQIIKYLRKCNFYPCGRFGWWDYLWSDQSYFSGVNTSREILEGKI